MSSAEALKKPQTAYFLWLNANREKISGMVGSKDVKAVAAKASELWKTASPSEKNPFEQEAKKQKDAYDKFLQTPEGQKALEEKKAGQKECKQAKQDKADERARKLEEKQVAREKREAKAAVKAVEKDDRLKKPMTAYFMYLGENRERITAMVGGKGGPEVAKKASQMWKDLPEKEKKPYEDRARKEKEEYDAYIKTPEGAAALKAYKDATAAVSYKEKPKEQEEKDAAKDEAADDKSPQAKKVGRKRTADKIEDVANAKDMAAKKKRAVKAGA